MDIEMVSDLPEEDLMDDEALYGDDDLPPTMEPSPPGASTPLAEVEMAPVEDATEDADGDGVMAEDEAVLELETEGGPGGGEDEQIEAMDDVDLPASAATADDILPIIEESTAPIEAAPLPSASVEASSPTLARVASPPLAQASASVSLVVDAEKSEAAEGSELARPGRGRSSVMFRVLSPAVADMAFFHPPFRSLRRA